MCLFLSQNRENDSKMTSREVPIFQTIWGWGENKGNSGSPKRLGNANVGRESHKLRGFRILLKDEGPM